MARQRDQARNHLSVTLIGKVMFCCCLEANYDLAEELHCVMTKLYAISIQDFCEMLEDVAAKFPDCHFNNLLCSTADRGDGKFVSAVSVIRGLISDIQMMCHGLCLQCLLDKAGDPLTCMEHL